MFWKRKPLMTFAARGTGKSRSRATRTTPNHATQPTNVGSKTMNFSSDELHTISEACRIVWAQYMIDAQTCREQGHAELCEQFMRQAKAAQAIHARIESEA